MYFQELYDSSNMSILIAFIFYLIRIYPSYVMAKKANLKHSWMMLFPVSWRISYVTFSRIIILIFYNLFNTSC